MPFFFQHKIRNTNSMSSLLNICFQDGTLEAKDSLKGSCLPQKKPNPKSPIFSQYLSYMLISKKENKLYVTILLDDKILPAVLQEANPAKKGSLPIKSVERGTSYLLILATEIYLTPNPNRNNTRRLAVPHLLGTCN